MTLLCPFASKISMANAQGYSRSWVQLWLLKARPMAAMASAVRGTKAVYYKEGIDPCKCATHYGQHLPLTSFRTGINDDESGLHHDYEVGLERLAPHAPTGQCRPRGRLHNRTGEDACPEQSDRNADAHLKRNATRTNCASWAARSW